MSSAVAARPGAKTPAAPRARKSRHDKITVGLVIFYVILVFFAVLYLFPFLIQLGTAFKTEVDSTNTPLNPVPENFTTAAFSQLADANYPRWFLNSTVVAISVTVARVFFDSLAGYALSRLKFRGRGAVFGALIAVMAVPGVVLLIPKFLVLNQLGLYNSYAGMILPLIVDAAGVFIMKQFFDSIPIAVEEAARIDGAGVFRTFWSVVLPMAKPALITLTILSFQGSWNELPHFIVATSDPALSTLTRGTANLLSGGLGSGNRFPLKMAAGLIMTIPVAIVFFIFQRRIMSTTEGGEKG